MQGFRPESVRWGVAVLGGAAGVWMLAVRAPEMWTLLILLVTFVFIFSPGSLFREKRAAHVREDVEAIKVCASEANLLAVHAAVESARASSVEEQARVAQAIQMAQTANQLVEKRLRALGQGRSMVPRDSDQIDRLTGQIKKLNTELSA
jgi:hypothetical protein